MRPYRTASIDLPFHPVLLGVSWPLSISDHAQEAIERLGYKHRLWAMIAQYSGFEREQALEHLPAAHNV